MVPSSGVISPKRHFINTVFPDPLCPMIKLVLPLSKQVVIPFNTSTPSKDLWMLFTSIISPTAFGLVNNLILLWQHWSTQRPLYLPCLLPRHLPSYRIRDMRESWQ